MPEQPPPEAPETENKQATTIPTTSYPRPSFREQIAALGRGELAGKERAFDAGQRGETGTGERTVSLETRHSEFAPYLVEVKRRIERQWHIPVYAREVGLTGKLVLVFSITMGGDLTRVQVSKSSGVSILDDAAVEAVKAAAPYAPFPPMFTFRQLNIIANFEYVARAARAPRSR
ncbi:MAG: TonB family protein [Candidatus Methylomirabilales bacterium]